MSIISGSADGPKLTQWDVYFSWLVPEVVLFSVKLTMTQL